MHAALVAMLLRALIPAGWMPQSAAAGSPFVICTADGAVHPAKPHDADRGKSPPCAFAAAGHLAPPAPSPAFATAIGVSSITHEAAREAPAVAAPYRSAAPRGPPTFG
ncbi:MAG TPA: hypothetical protein VG889_21960 [Rhizomicrobium sp.]|nr:hypothetical protein [Rhizomicrobium sp.]